MRNGLALSHLVVCLFVAIGTLQAQQDPLAGTWRLNVAKSQFGGSARSTQVTKLESIPNGLKSTSDTTSPQGGSAHTEYTAYFDGKDYPLTGDAAGSTISLKRIDARTMDLTTKRNGSVYRTSRWTVSADGRTLTRTQKVVDAQGRETSNVLVYDKQ